MTMSTKAHTRVRIDRIAAATLLLFSIIYGFAGSRIEYAFASDPLGPRTFPVLLAATLALLSLAYLLRPGGAEPWPSGSLLARSVALPALVVVAALILEPAGFFVAMFVLTAGVGRVFGASWRKAILGGVMQAALWYFVFGYLLEVYLPAGDLFAG